MDAQYSLKDLYNMAKDNFKNTNLASNWGTYIPYTANLGWKERPFPGMSSPLGFVHPFLGQDNMYLNPKARWDQIRLLETLAHEAAHTKQKLGLAELMNKDVQQASGTKFEDYDYTNMFPRGIEILAELRAKEALAPKGQLWYTTPVGQEYLKNLRQRFPDKSISGLVESTDRGIFPEYSVAHPDNGTFTPANKPSVWQGLKQLFGK